MIIVTSYKHNNWVLSAGIVGDVLAPSTPTCAAYATLASITCICHPKKGLNLVDFTRNYGREVVIVKASN